MVITAIQSVLSQTVIDWELIIIDDGSTDGTANSVASFKDQRIHYFYQSNQERSRSRNNGILHAKGDFICFLDSDDYYLPDHLNSLQKLINSKNKEVGIYATGAFVDRGNSKIKLSIFQGDEHPVRYVFHKKLDMNTVCVQASIFKKFQFDTSLNIGEDTHLWLRIVKEFPLFQSTDYTTVTVNHEMSGMVKYYNEADTNQLKLYVNGARNLFKILDVSPYITKKEQNHYISKKYRSMARSCIWAKKMGGVFTCTSKAIYWTPSFVFTNEFFNILKETIVMMGRIILRKPTTQK